MNISIDGNTTLVLIVACFCVYWSISAWASGGKND